MDTGQTQPVHKRKRVIIQYKDAQIKTKTTLQCTRPPAGVLNGVVFYNPESEVWNTVVRSKCFKRAFFLHLLHEYLGNVVRRTERETEREREMPASHRPSVARWHSSLVKDVGGWIFSSICLPNRSQKSGESNTDLYAPEIKTWNKLRKSKMRLFRFL